MKKFKSAIILLFICAVICLAIFWYFLAGNNKKSNVDHLIQDINASTRLLKNVEMLHNFWIEAEESRQWSLIKGQCLESLKITKPFDESLLRCNPLLMECFAKFAKGQNFKILPATENDQKLHYHFLSKENSNVKELKRGAYLFNIEDNESKKRMSFTLESNCHEIYLQQRLFAYGEEFKDPGAVDYQFDNFNRHLYVDRSLVTNADINEWIFFGMKKEIKGLKKKEGNDLFLPAIDLNYTQMNNYCSFKEKQLMMAHIFDAATFLPMNLQEIRPKKIHRSPYYWTKKSQGISPTCSEIYTKECLEQSEFRLNASGPSWAGIYDSMGGVMEAFRNPIDSQSNLKASSFYYERLSSWHKLGFRAYWDGVGFDYKNFDFRGLSPFIADEKIKVGFRCMREAQ